MNDQDTAAQDFECFSISVSADTQRRAARQFLLRVVVTVAVSAATTMGMLVLYSWLLGPVGS